jgi:hypothetical protein
MKYHVAIYDLEFEVDAKSEEGAVRGAIARYAKAPSAHFRHCTPDRLTRRDNYCNDRDWVERQWISCRYLMGLPAVLVHHGVERQEPTPAELVS